MAYTYTNSKGTDYYLHSRVTQLKNGREQRIYFFARDVRSADALEAVPAGYEVSENTRSGLPILRKER